MPIKFVRKQDIRVDSLVVSIYGKPGTGKTSLALTSKNPVLLDFDLAAYRAKDAPDAPTVLVRNWADVADLRATDLAEFDTIVIDTAGKCVESMLRSIVPSGNPKQNDWGTLKQQFERWVGMLKSAGKDIVFIVHMQETPQGDEIRERFMVLGQSRELIYQVSDLIGKLDQDDRRDERYITFNPTAVSHGKNVDIDRTVMPHPKVAPDTLAKIIDAAKSNLNAQVGASAETSKKLDILREALNALPADPHEFNSRVEKMRNEDAPNDERQILLQVAQAKGLTWDRDAKAFTTGDDPEEDVPETEAQVDSGMVL